MKGARLKNLQKNLKYPLLIKKKENLLYLTGRSFSSGCLLVTKDGLNFLDDGLEKLEGIKRDRLKYIGNHIKPGATLLLEDVFTFAEADYLKTKIEKVKCQAVKSPVDEMRAVKEKFEIESIRRSMKICETVFFAVRKQLKNKLWSEIELANFIRKTGSRLGAEDVSFDPIVAAGVHAAIPHHVPSKKILRSGESIILDFGFKYKGYCGDFTRTIFLKKVPNKLGTAYEYVEKAYMKTFLLAKPGIKTNKLYQTAVDVLAERKLDKYFIHNLGHGTGLEIHELPNLSPQSKESLQYGNVVSIEPGVYLPKIGGIRIEDLVYLEHDRCAKFVFVSTKLADNIF